MHFVFVPGPADPYDVSNLILPRRPLPPSLTKAVRDKLPKVTFASNPCRITYKSQEIVVFRDDLMSRMLRNTVRLKNDLSSLANKELLEMMESEEGEHLLGVSGQVDNWTDNQKGEARLKILSQFVSLLTLSATPTRIAHDALICSLFKRYWINRTSLRCPCKFGQSSGSSTKPYGCSRYQLLYVQLAYFDLTECLL